MRTRATGLHPFIPSGPDFERALAFFLDIGFQKTWSDGSLAGLRYDEAHFLLQKLDLKVWQENQMIVLEVEDLDSYWDELSSKGLPAKYPGVKIKPPEDYPWGREMHIIDPAGVCWHVRRTPASSKD